MAAIPPNNYLDGFIKSMKDGVYGVYNKGVKYGRYLAQQEYLQLKQEHEALLKRFRHLLESEYIASFDAVDPTTQEYVRDISEAEPVRHGRWIPNIKEDYMAYPPYTYQSGYKCSLCDRVVRTNKEPYCHCGAKMEGEENDKGN